MVGYKQIIVIGYGIIAGDVLSFIDGVSDKYGYSVLYIEYEKYPFNMAKKYAEKNAVEFLTIEDKVELDDVILKRAELGRLLIVSASNNYIFPQKIVQNINVTIVNFHNALLPDLPGRNAPSWAIYKGYKKTGITWHYVTIGIDEGDIIIQKECKITSEMKAYELVSIQMKLAGEAFKECFGTIIDGSVKRKKQIYFDNRKLYKSTDIPGEGRFDINDTPEEIYRLLRAVDYGKNNIFPPIISFLKNKKIIIKRYKRVAEKRLEHDDKIYLPFETGGFLMLKYEFALNE